MTVWNYSISWGKLKLALNCQQQLQWTIDKKPHSVSSTNYYMCLGKAVQYVFEMYFNQEINLRPGGTDLKVRKKVVQKVLDSPYLRSLKIEYPLRKTPEDFIKRFKAQVMAGFRHFESMGLLHKKIQSEVKWHSTFRGFRMFCLIDFLVEEETGEFSIYDGKGNTNQDADPNQVKYYGLALASSNRRLNEGGLIYWDHGLEEVDLSPPALKEFVDEVIDTTAPIFFKLRTGSEDFPTNPSPENCKYCAWRQSCKDSAVKIPDLGKVIETGRVSLGD